MESTHQKGGILCKGTSTPTLQTNETTPVDWNLPKSSPECFSSECGTGHGMAGCPNGHRESDKRLMYHCDNPLCPICGDHWISKQSKRAEQRLKGAEELYAKAGKPLKDIRHISFHPPYEEGIVAMESVEGYRKLKAKAIKTIKTTGKKDNKKLDFEGDDKYGIVGGCMVFHPWRFNDPKKPNYRPDLPDYEYYLFPHFHVLGYGYLLDADMFYKLAGWTYRNHGVRDSVIKTLIYELGHCGIGRYDYDKKLQANTWFGELGYNQLKKDGEKVEEKTIKCEVCGEDLHLYGNVYFNKRKGEEEEDTKDKEDEGVFTYKEKTPIFILKKEPTKQSGID